MITFGVLLSSGGLFAFRDRANHAGLFSRMFFAVSSIVVSRCSSAVRPNASGSISSASSLKFQYAAASS